MPELFQDFDPARFWAEVVIVVASLIGLAWVLNDAFFGPRPPRR